MLSECNLDLLYLYYIDTIHSDIQLFSHTVLSYYDEVCTYTSGLEFLSWSFEW